MSLEAAQNSRDGLTERLQARLTPEELTDVKAAAREDGITPSRWVRQAIRDHLELQPEKARVTEYLPALKDLHQDLARIGGNLNQLAYYHHIEEPVADETLASNLRLALDEFSKLSQTLKALRHDLYRRNR